MNKRTKRLTEENEILCGELSTEAKEVLRNVTGYIQRFGISRYEQEKVRQDIAEMILEGEKRGIPVSETIGDDYQAFCDSVLAEMPRMTGREKLLTIVRDICLFLAVWLGRFWYLPQDMYTAGSCRGRRSKSISDTCWPESCLLRSC